MESGTNNLKPLLTIAIPTWNRAKTLDKALSFLIPQLYEYKNDIELIISDNASTDETNSVVQIYKKENSDLNFIDNRNEENIQFFGNFSKCRELAKGKYIWILSDDDFVKENLIRELISKLKVSTQCACVYLKNNFKSQSFSYSIVSKEELIEKENYSLGLISAVIFLNNKQNDKFLLDTYFKSPFLGFIFLLNSLVILKKKYPKIRLKIAGNWAVSTAFYLKSGYLKWFESKAKKLGVYDCLEFLGPLNATQLVDQMLNSDVFIVPSYIETYCLAFAEAMAVGIPCVVSYAGAMSELAVEKESALFFPIGDYYSCAGCIDKILTNPVLAESLSNLSRKIARNRNNSNAIVQNQLKIYSYLLNTL